MLSKISKRSFFSVVRAPILKGHDIPMIKWHAQPGEKVQPGDVLCDVDQGCCHVTMLTREKGIIAKRLGNIMLID